MDGADLKQEELGIVRLCGHQAFAHMVTGFGQDSYIAAENSASTDANYSIANSNDPWHQLNRMMMMTRQIHK